MSASVREAALAFALALAGLGGPAGLRAQETGDSNADADQEEAATPAPASPAKGLASMGNDKAGIKKYLDHRLAKIKAAERKRLDFAAKDGAAWTDFWSKVVEQRNLFEVRIARQRLDLFESLASLDSREHAAAIADFERLQNNLVHTFENAQREKMRDFFAARERRWKDFYAAQEKERAAFAAEVDESWDQLKAVLKLRGSALPASRRKLLPF